ncbi:hypothetical protein ACFLSW_05075 [Candidatus Bipolaricaulota bacterium]
MQYLVCILLDVTRSSPFALGQRGRQALGVLCGGSVDQRGDGLVQQLAS